MRQAQFEDQHQDEWQALLLTVEALEQHDKDIDPDGLSRFGERYRQLVRHHALAIDRQYSAGLIDHLQQLLQRAHHQLYRSRELLLNQTLHFLVVGFPTALRRHVGYFWLATALFYVPALAMGIWCYVQPDAIYTVLGSAEVAQMEYSYDPATAQVGRGSDRQSETNFQMLGYYIYNNTHN